MKDRLEEFVKNHQDEFDCLEPAPELWNRIQQKLPNRETSRFRPFLWKAAAVAIVFGISFWAQKQMDQLPVRPNAYFSIQPGNKKVEESKPEVAEKTVEHIHKAIPELAETEKFYSLKLQKSMKEMNVYLVKYPDVASNMKKDLAELDSIYKSLKKDLGDNVANEEIINAMIQNYRMKLQMLEDIKNAINQKNTDKLNPKNDTHEI